MEERGFKIVKSYAKTLSRMSDQDRGQLLKLVCDWVFSDNPADRSIVELQVPDSMCALFDIITERARKDIEKSERISETNRRNIRRRWSARSAQGDTVEYGRIRSNTVEYENTNRIGETPPSPPKSSSLDVSPTTPSINPLSIPPISPVESRAQTRETPTQVDMNSLFVSSMEREALGFKPESIVDAKREKLRMAVTRLAASGDDRWKMTQKQIDRFVSYWGERLRNTDHIRAEMDEYFSLPDKMERWISGDQLNTRGKEEKATQPIDARPISERMILKHN